MADGIAFVYSDKVKDNLQSHISHDLNITKQQCELLDNTDEVWFYICSNIGTRALTPLISIFNLSNVAGGNQ
ncbi:hypothetical protein J6590_005605 [Homalodisca vitripennis]|nr:hypothetical protein J6590_005605 [Homalodisca vitripennis]